MIRGASYTIDLIFNAEYTTTRVSSMILTIGNYDVCSLADGSIVRSGQHFMCSIPSDVTAVLPVGERSVTLTMNDTTDGVRKAVIATIPIQNTGSQYENENISETANMTLELTYMVNNISADLLITDVTALRAIAAAAAAKDSEDKAKVSEDNAKESETNAAQSESDTLGYKNTVQGLHDTVVADAAQVALDRIATGEDAAQTALDRIATGQDAQTATTKAGEASGSAAAALQSKNYAAGYADDADAARILAEEARDASIAKVGATVVDTLGPSTADAISQNKATQIFGKNSIGYITPSTTTSYINFDFANSRITISGTMVILTKTGLAFPSDGNITIDSNTRFLIWNNTDSIFVAVGNDLTAYLNKDIYLIAALRLSLARVYWCGLDKYKINGKEYGLVDTNKLAQSAMVGYFSPSVNTGNINFDFSANKITITDLVVLTKSGFVALTNQDVTIDANSRLLYFNATANTVVASAADSSALFTSEIYLLAAFRPSLTRVYWCGIERYKINGAYENPTERHNMWDYVQGQKMVANKYSIPVCNLYEEAGFNYLNKASFIQSDDLHYAAAGYTFISQQTTEFIKKYGGFTSLTGKKIAVFGGSYSVIPESHYCKDVWVSQLGVAYTDFGVSGAGFSSLANSKIDVQVDGADNSFDIYLIWCSTNDCANNVKIGNLTTADITTQTKGMMVTIEKILALKPTAKILIFSSMKAFNYEYMYNPIIDRY